MGFTVPLSTMCNNICLKNHNEKYDTQILITFNIETGNENKVLPLFPNIGNKMCKKFNRTKEQIKKKFKTNFFKIGMLPPVSETKIITIKDNF